MKIALESHDSVGNAPNSSPRKHDYDDEEEEDACRICRNSGDLDNPLQFPCACRGSMKFVHRDCLLGWLNHSRTRHCEVCRHPFSFSFQYAENAPTRLPIQEFVIGIAMKTVHLLVDILKGAINRVSDVATFTVGYMVIFSTVIFNFGVALTRGDRLILRQVWREMRRLITMIKVGFLLVIWLGVFPQMCGWWIDVCTLEMVGKSISQRVCCFSCCPLQSLFIHWVVGIVYIIQINVFVIFLHEVLREGIVYFFRDLTDPNYNPFRGLFNDPVWKHAGRVLLSVAVHGSLIVMLVFLPVKLAMRIAPSIFPLDITLCDPVPEITNYINFFHMCVHTAGHFSLGTRFCALLRYWFKSVGGALGLNGYLLQENGNDPLHANHAQERYTFVVRIVALLFAGWMTLLIVNSALIVGPVSVGRLVINAVLFLLFLHDFKCNDIFAFVIGSCTILTTVVGVRYSVDQIRRRNFRFLLRQIWKWCSIAIKSCVLLWLWFFVIPALIGLLFELLLIVPMRVPVDEDMLAHLFLIWSVGLTLLFIWTLLVMLGHLGFRLPFVDPSWQWKFERVRNDGFSRLHAFWVFQEIFVPIILNLLTALCLPFLLVCGVFLVCRSQLAADSAVYRCAWLGWHGLKFACLMSKKLHNSIRDERYLIGRTLRNFGEN